jgi:hypothetical protein
MNIIERNFSLLFRQRENDRGRKMTVLGKASEVEVLNYAEKHGSEALSENNHEDDFSNSGDDFVGFYDE